MKFLGIDLYEMLDQQVHKAMSHERYMQFLEIATVDVEAGVDQAIDQYKFFIDFIEEQYFDILDEGLIDEGN